MEIKNERAYTELRHNSENELTIWDDGDLIVSGVGLEDCVFQLPKELAGMIRNTIQKYLENHENE